MVYFLILQYSSNNKLRYLTLIQHNKEQQQNNSAVISDLIRKLKEALATEIAAELRQEHLLWKLQTFNQTSANSTEPGIPMDYAYTQQQSTLE